MSYARTPRRGGARLLALTAAGLVVAALTLGPGSLVGPARRTLGRLAEAVPGTLPTMLPFGLTEQALNVLLFVPLGAAVAVLLPRRGWPVAIVIPLVLSAAVEFAQGSIPGRVTDPGDVLWNTVGGAIGVISVTLLRVLGSGLRRTLQRRSVTRA